MGFLDSLKDTAKSVADQTKTKISDAKSSYEKQQTDKKEAQRLAEEGSKAEATTKTEQILSGKNAEKTGIFRHDPMEKILSFTEEYMTRLVLPASSLSVSKLKMIPYVGDNVTKRNVSKIFDDISDSEKIIFLLDNNRSKEFLIVTTSFLYAKISFGDTVKTFYNIKIALDDISSITFETEDEMHKIFCNGIYLMGMPEMARNTDYINMKHYFERLGNSDFDISDEDVDNLIHEKIGDEAYNDTKKYIDDDELIVYFAWGCDSITAKDYLMCTTKQFVMLNRELMGMSQDVKKFYYDDIVSMSIQQSDNTITGTFLFAALKLCDLIVHVTGTSLRISTLSTVEADRVIHIYNEFKKVLREEAKKPIVIQQVAHNQPEADPLEQIQKLQKLKEAGIISEEEFNTKKSDLLQRL